jgi:hypothetical protein
LPRRPSNKSETQRVRVAGVTLALRAGPEEVPLPPLFGAWPRFAVRSGADIRIELRSEPAPVPGTDEPLFDSTSTWRVYRRGTGTLYTFSSPAARPPLYKALAMDADWSEGTLYWPHPHVGRHPLEYPLDELLFQHRLARSGALEIHGCAVVVSGRVWLFCGQSGAGKSTTARLWRRLQPRTEILSDDRVVLRRRGTAVWAYGTPWHGTAKFHSPRGGPLGAVCFLEQAEATELRQVGPAEGGARLFARGFPPPWDSRGIEAALGLCETVATSVPCYRFAFRRDRSAVEAVLGQARARPTR